MEMFAKNIFAMEEDGEREESKCKILANFSQVQQQEKREMQAFHNFEILGLHG